MEKRPVAYQLYSARDDAQQNLESVLKKLSELGYDGVEFAGFYGYSAPQIKEKLDKFGLKAVSSHVPFQTIVDDMFGTISFHKSIGCRFIAIPYLDNTTRPGAAGFAGALREMHRFGVLMREAGMTLLYHNHDFEFVEVSGQYGLDFLYDVIDHKVIQTEIDICWVKYAGLDPAEYIKKYTNRCPVVHLKDFVGHKGDEAPYGLIGQKEKSGHTEAFEFRPVGYGCQDIRSVLNTAIACGAEWFVVEQDMSVQRSPLEDAELSIGTLIKLGLK